ncbi:hypothetical protein L1077_21740 [Pseudoalteromonas luteoviolacea]|uniref:hypothetical protein n=1 Tax=Pseudoalteromonas luteoviolacea TaxID=43657 RepID=UPI001F2B0D53|nr:hypothetical protein [Pseudoalteromonas luteoviolacea]MCF6442057.1 hypothetical protein [Pseudoalteromonas luteoviolacea]
MNFLKTPEEAEAITNKRDALILEDQRRQCNARRRIELHKDNMDLAALHRETWELDTL